MKKKSIITMVLVLAAIVTILTYFGIKPSHNEPTSSVEKTDVSTVGQSGGVTAKTIEENITVTSHNQSGGITAGKLTVGRQPRKLTPNDAAQLTKQLSRDKDVVINIDAVWGDQEAFQFAEAVKAYLESQGRKVNGVSQVAYSKPVMGQAITEGGTRIIIGGRE